MRNVFQESKRWADLARSVSFASELSDKLVYTVKDDVTPITGSSPTAYSRLHDLESFGLAKLKRGIFQVNTSAVYQPLHIVKKLQSSLDALQQARRFGKYYTESDINFVNKRLPGKFLKTLDYAAWELTKFQTPQDLFIYVEDLDDASAFLIDNGFNEGENGRIILLPKTGSFTNEVERVYFDCIAKGGRSTGDAIAIELLFREQLSTRGRFSVDEIMKVVEDLQEYRNRIAHESISA